MKLNSLFFNKIYTQTVASCSLFRTNENIPVLNATISNKDDDSGIKKFS